MKKTISILTSALALLFVATSCGDKGETNSTQAGTGKLNVTFGFSSELPEIPEMPRAAYIPSTATPGTSWTKNIKDLMILCVDASNTVKAARVVDLSATGDNMNPLTPQVFQGIPVGTYTIYAVANSGQSTIASSFTGVSDVWNAGTFIGKNINNALLKLTAITPTPGTADGVLAANTAYNVPAEIFVGFQAGVVIPLNGPNSVQANIQLARAVGLMRVRIDQSLNGNDGVDFATSTPAKGAVHIRRATQQWSLGTGIPAAGSRAATNEILVKAAFSKTVSPAGYTGDMNLENGITSWADVIMFPGGSASTTDGTDKFEILLSGLAPNGYVSSEGTTINNATTPIYWAGQVTGVVIANGILEVNCTLNSKGSTTIPEEIKTGSLDVKVNLVGWGNIISTNVGM